MRGFTLLYKTFYYGQIRFVSPTEAKPGKEKEVADFLKSAIPLVAEEPGTIHWFALQLGPSTFGIFDTFEQGRCPQSPSYREDSPGLDGQCRRHFWLRSRDRAGRLISCSTVQIKTIAHIPSVISPRRQAVPSIACGMISKKILPVFY